jgi:hypothetical protein
MSSNSTAMPLRVWSAGEVDHPAWCSPAHCSTVVIETGPSDDDLMVSLRLYDVPALVARLLDLYPADLTQ